MKNITKISINTLAAVIFGVLSFGSVALADQSATTTLLKSGSYVVEPGVTSMTVTVVAGGAGGGGGAATYGGGGGGAGAYTSVTISVTPGQIIPYTIGAGGIGGAAGSASVKAGNGTDGGSTSFGAFVSALGGKGGQGAAYSIGNGIGGLAGGIGGTNGTNGASASNPTRTYGGNGGSNTISVGGAGSTGNNTSYVAPIAGTKGTGGGAGSGWKVNSNGTIGDAGANGGAGRIIVSFTADLTAPVITILPYSTSSTNSNVVVTAITNEGTIVGTSSIASIVSAGATSSATFSNNGTVTFTATDAAGNVSTKTVTITNIDKVAPVITVLPYSTSTTNSNVSVTAITSEGLITASSVTPAVIASITSSGATSTVVFSDNGTVTFTAVDAAGNFSTRTITISNIDKVAPVITILPYATTSTNSDITVFAITNEGTIIGTSSIALIANFGATSSATFGGNGTVTFTATDAAGNFSTRTVTISNIDKIAPVITILGTNPASVEINTIYTDAGVSVTDNSGVPLTFTSSSSVNTSVFGSYAVDYTTTDLAGNVATATRIVNVVDTTIPVVTVPATQSFEATGPVTTPVLVQATAIDNSGTSPVITYNPTGFVLGTSTVVWTATDTSGNFATATSLVVIKDTTGPAMSLIGSSTVVLNVGDAYVEGGATSVDLVEGVRSVSIFGIVNTAVAGTYTLNYISSDLSANTSVLTRTVVVSAIIVPDTTAPVITILGANPDSVLLGSVYADAGATALDNVDGPVAVIATGTVDTSIVGTYTITYTATDAALNVATATRTVNVTAVIIPDVTAPVITLNGSSTINLLVGATYTELGATAIDAVDGPVAVSATGTVDTSATGTYTVTYTATDAAMNSATATRTIIVSNIIVPDVTAPVITLNGVNPTFVMIGTVYADAGATAIDAVDGIIIVSATGTVNTAVAGTYTIVYSASDLSGNTATTSRTVNVITAQVVIINSTVEGTLYAALSTISGFIPSITGTTTIVNSTLASTTVDNSNLTNVDSSADSVIQTSNLIRCTLVNSTVIDFTGADCYIAYSYIDPSRGLGATSTYSRIINSIFDYSVIDHSYLATSTVTNTLFSYSTSTDSIVDRSVVNNSVIANNSNVSSSTVSNSNLSNDIVTNSTVATSTATDSTITNSTVDNSTSTGSVISDSIVTDSILTNATSTNSNIASSTITDSTLVNSTSTNSVISSSTLTNVIANNSTVSSSTLANLILDNATVINDIISTGTITIGGNVYVISTSTPISSLITDTTAPVITLNGAVIVNIVIGGAYAELGATAIDAIDGPRTVTITGAVNTAVIGTYIVTYSATDTKANLATTSRTINVIATPDVTAPVITILGANPDSVMQNAVYADAGATAFDNVDGTTTINVIGLPLNTTVAGAQTVTYTSTDSSGNTSTSTRTVNVIATPVDTIAPVITITGGTPTTIALGSVYADAGATAMDNVDGTTSVSILSNDVNTAATGTYSVVYSATDLSGNNSTATRTVNVIDAPADMVAPVISITGGTPITVIASSTYTDAGATALDNIDGDVTASIVATGIVDTNTIGTYFISYSANDAAGNIGYATRTVNVIVGSTTADVIPPVITVINGTPVTITVGTVYTDAGATALDETDGDVTASIVTTGAVNTVVVGTYTLTYTANDAAGNIATATRDIIVIAATADVTAPVISITGGTPITVTQGSVYADAGATAFDAVSGTTTITVVSNDVNTAATGTYSVVYSSTDGAGNVATATRTVIVTFADTVAPVITVLGANPMTVIRTLAYTELGATAIDGVDGARPVAITGAVNTNATGTYTIVYTSTDLSGNSASTTRIVNVIEDNIAPVITIVGANPVNITVGGVYADAGATALDNVDGVITASTTSNNVDTAVVGIYSVVYSATDAAGNTSTLTRTVNVNAADAIAPVITILGANPVTVLVGAVYADAGATALDNLDGVRSVSSISTVNTAIAGAYTVVYSATDTVGNLGTATRTINVVATPDVTAPVITIVGANPASVTVGAVYADAGATATDNVDGNITANITVSNTVNTAAIGTYAVTYFVNDGAGNAASTTRTVNVIAAPVIPPTSGGNMDGSEVKPIISTPTTSSSDTVSPVITIVGANPASVTVDTNYVDAGATATDNVDGNITSKITVASYVNTAIVGTYSVIYSVKDNAGNVSSVVRNVTVIAKVIPTTPATNDNGGSTQVDNTGTGIEIPEGVGQLNPINGSTSTVGTSTGTTTANASSTRNLGFVATVIEGFSSVPNKPVIAIILLALAFLIGFGLYGRKNSKGGNPPADLPTGNVDSL